MALFVINSDDVIRTQNGLWQWDEDEERFLDTGNTYEKPADLKSVNAVYKHGNPNQQCKIEAGDLIEVEKGTDYSGKLFTIIDVTVIDVTELFNVAHKACINISNYIAGLDGNSFSKINDLTMIPNRKENA